MRLLLAVLAAMGLVGCEAALPPGYYGSEEKHRQVEQVYSKGSGCYTRAEMLRGSQTDEVAKLYRQKIYKATGIEMVCNARTDRGVLNIWCAPNAKLQHYLYSQEAAFCPRQEGRWGVAPAVVDWW